MGMAISVPRYTIDDLERFPDDGNRYEVLDGFLMVTPAPGGPPHSLRNASTGLARPARHAGPSEAAAAASNSSAATTPSTRGSVG